ncbi:MAG: hypothetical protein ACPGU9_04775 [Flavobacteriaceae bacterium]
MKNIFKTIGALALTSIIFTSCNDDDHTGQSTMDYSPVTITLSSSSPTVFSENAIDADDASTYTVTIDATIPEAQYIQYKIDLVQTGGTADSHDISLGTITIPVGATTASATVEILQTGDIEGDETFTVTGVSRANAIVAPYEYSGTITNDYINDVLEMGLEWEGTVEFETDYSNGEYNFCAMDFDLLVYDPVTFADLGMYDAATSACPEHINFDASTPDGDYLMVANLYANDYETLGLGADVPLTLTYTQEYFEESTDGSITIPDAFNTDNPAGGSAAIATITKAGTSYTITPF